MVVDGSLDETKEGEFGAGNIEAQLSIVCLLGGLEVSIVVEVQVSASNLIVDGARFGLFFGTCASLSALSGDGLEVGIGFAVGELGVLFDGLEFNFSWVLLGVLNGEILGENGLSCDTLNVDVGGGNEAVHHVVVWLHAETELDVVVGLGASSDFGGEVTVEFQGATVVGVVRVEGKLKNVFLEELGGDGVSLAETVVVTDGDGDGSEES